MTMITVNDVREKVMAEGGPIPGAKLVVVPKSAEDQIRKVADTARYAMDSTSAKLLKETGRRAAMRLFDMLGNDEKWEQLGQRNQIALVELALTRAFGRVENVTADEKLTDSKGEVAGALPMHLKALAGRLTLPELQGAKAAVERDD